MRRFVLVLVGLFGAVLLAYAGVFAYRNLRGIGPVIKPPPVPIAQESKSLGFPLKLPSGFSISVFSSTLGAPRVLAFDPSGTLLVSIPSQGKVVALPDRNSDGSADGTITVIEGLNKPHGLAFQPTTKKLYIAETDQVAVYDYDQGALRASNKKKIVDLSGGGNHFSRTIGFGPDGKLYIAVGSSCNVCIEADQRRATILVADVTGRDPVTKVFASGLRNSVFFTWHPVTKDMWATDMGRDLIGDDIPPDEINIVKEDSFYGWPYCYGKNVQDKTFTQMGSGLRATQGLPPTEICQNATPSHIDLQAHSAPLGLAFVLSSWPAEYRDDLLIAYHGSWNRSTPTGYKVVRMKLDAQGNYEGTDDFITGLLPQFGASDGALGRPVDLLFDSQGNLYISDDKAGIIYKVHYIQ